MTSVSIVLASYNGGRFRDRQWQSLRDQSTAPDELIITDDRATNDTVDIARRFASDAPFPVTVVVNDTQIGARGNFFLGVSLATQCSVVRDLISGVAGYRSR